MSFSADVDGVRDQLQAEDPDLARRGLDQPDGVRLALDAGGHVVLRVEQKRHHGLADRHLDDLADQRAAVLGGRDDRVVDGDAGGRPDVDRDRVLVGGRRLLEHLAGDALGLPERASEVQERLQPGHLGLRPRGRAPATLPYCAWSCFSSSVLSRALARPLPQFQASTAGRVTRWATVGERGRHADGIPLDLPHNARRPLPEGQGEQCERGRQQQADDGPPPDDSVLAEQHDLAGRGADSSGRAAASPPQTARNARSWRPWR